MEKLSIWDQDICFHLSSSRGFPAWNFPGLNSFQEVGFYAGVKSHPSTPLPHASAQAQADAAGCSRSRSGRAGREGRAAPGGGFGELCLHSALLETQRSAQMRSPAPQWSLLSAPPSRLCQCEVRGGAGNLTRLLTTGFVLSTPPGHLPVPGLVNRLTGPSRRGE